MGCLCSKGHNVNDYVAETEREKERDVNKSSLHVIAPSSNREEIIVGSISESNVVEENGKMDGHHRRSTMDLGGVNGMQQTMSRMPNGKQVAAGWPSWLAAVAGEAIQGWVPRSADSYQKLNKIGQGTYSSVYKARDLTTDTIVAMKKVRFFNMDPESVRFMAREICILRKLDHPNVMKLEAIVTSRISGSLYLVFEYMDHDLAGLLASPGVKFTEPQIKCYMKQLLLGLEHCHNRGILHRDMKGSNLLVDNNGVLKIGDFGLATSFEADQKQPLTSRVVTLWYRPPELLLGATQYGVAIDLWSAGCILAELFAGKPIMPGRTEVEQMHKIFKLCGSPTQEYWRTAKLPHATSFKSHPQYKRRVAETFKDFPSSALALIEVLLSIDPDKRGTASAALKSKFFTSNPLPCDPSSLPKYHPSKEFDAKIREKEARRQKAESVKGHGAEDVRNSSRAIPEGEGQSNKYNPQEESGTGFPIEPSRVKLKNGYSHSNSVIHPNAVAYSLSKSSKDDSIQSARQRTLSFSQHSVHFTRQGQSRDIHSKNVVNNDSIGYVAQRNRMHFSGPLMAPGGNVEDMLKEHERQIQEAVRKARTKEK